MATTKHQIGTAWTELTEAGTDKDFILQHASASGILQARFADTHPPETKMPTHYSPTATR